MASRRLRREAIAVSGLGGNRAGAARTRGPMAHRRGPATGDALTGRTTNARSDGGAANLRVGSGAV